MASGTSLKKQTGLAFLETKSSIHHNNVNTHASQTGVLYLIQPQHRSPPANKKRGRRDYEKEFDRNRKNLRKERVL